MKHLIIIKKLLDSSYELYGLASSEAGSKKYWPLCKIEIMDFNQDDAIYSSNSKHLKLVE